MLHVDKRTDDYHSSYDIKIRSYATEPRVNLQQSMGSARSHTLTALATAH
jgi:hypothetical protein